MCALFFLYLKGCKTWLVKHIVSGNLSLRSVAVCSTPYDDIQHDYQSSCEAETRGSRLSS